MEQKRPLQRLLITGGAGFIGSAFIRYLLEKENIASQILNYDLLTYAANLNLLKHLENDPRYFFVQGDICDQLRIEKLLQDHQIDTIVHFAAETHVDRSIQTAAPFIQTNIQGTLSLLEAVRKFPHIHFHHISTDEVYGSLGKKGQFNEESPYKPNSPYAASKASSDHLVRAFAHTYHLSTTLSHCSNNYGPGQYPEKFIPLMILHCLQNKPLPVYGKGAQMRDWLYVDDHASAIWKILTLGERGETYDIGAESEMTNLDLLHFLLDLLSAETKKDYHSLIRFVTDRPGHDFRYAIDPQKMYRLGWRPQIKMKEGLKNTIHWYRSEYGDPSESRHLSAEDQTPDHRQLGANR